MISSGRLKDDGSGTIGYEDLGAFLGLISRISPWLEDFFNHRKSGFQSGQNMSKLWI